MNEKTVLITGASRGIGKACARIFARSGFRLVLTCHKNRLQLEQLKTELEKEYGAPCLISAGDAGEEDYVDALFYELEHFSDTLDVLINNAGIAHMGLLQDMTLDEWEQVIRTNLTSQFLCCRRAIPLMLKRHSGSIVNVSSVWAATGRPAKRPTPPPKAAAAPFPELSPENWRPAAYGSTPWSSASSTQI